MVIEFFRRLNEVQEAYRYLHVIPPWTKVDILAREEDRNLPLGDARSKVVVEAVVPLLASCCLIPSLSDTISFLFNVKDRVLDPSESTVV